MKMERCMSGHLYDPAKYEACPYCGSSAALKEPAPQAPQPPLGKNNRPQVMPKKADSKGKTVAFWERKLGIDPVVGWIACIEGPDRGKDYRLKTEKNFVGRGEDMDVSIMGDDTISRQNHAIISYNPKKRNFMLLPGTGNGIVYLNDEEVYVPQLLNIYDIIEMGKSKFIFIPLCGECFEWEESE